jgi:hypothetical protein
MRRRLSVSTKHMKFSCRPGLYVILGLASGCVGMRTPLDESGRTEQASDAGICGVSTTLRTVHPVADVLIVLDRSSSMNNSLTTNASCRAGATDCSSRLAAVSSAIETLVDDNSDIYWGLELFSTPNSSSCTVSSTPQVPVGANSASAIRAQLASLTTERSTPTTAALNVATAYLKDVSDGNSKAILLATDGLPTCASSSSSSDDLSEAVSAATAAKSAGFPVYVIGIGSQVSNLDSLAVAGGTRSYYPVTSTSELNSALTAIAKVVSLCTFRANRAPTNKDLVYVYVDGKLVAHDPDDGWMFDASDKTFSTITLTGRACQDMLAGRTATVEIVQYECNDAP